LPDDDDSDNDNDNVPTQRISLGGFLLADELSDSSEDDAAFVAALNAEVKPRSIASHLDDIVNRADDPDFTRRIIDPLTGNEVKISKEDYAIVRRIQKGRVSGLGADPFPDEREYFQAEIETMPLSSQAYEHKGRFTPSKWEAAKVRQLVKAIRAGALRQRDADRAAAAASKNVTQEDAWEGLPDDGTAGGRRGQVLQAPRVRPPRHEESFNPPVEFLPTDEERAAWDAADPVERGDPLPERFTSLRLVPSYEGFVRERFSRCLDLYLCPRTVREKRERVEPEQLLPELPPVDLLRPFPERTALVLRGHKHPVRAVAISPCGRWLASGCHDGMGTVKIWEIATGRCVSTYELGTGSGDYEGFIHDLAWCPRKDVLLLAAAVGLRVVLLSPHRCATVSQQDGAVALLEFEPEDVTTPTTVQWSCGFDVAYGEQAEGETFRAHPLDDVLAVIRHPQPVRRISWHSLGDYLLCVVPKQPSLAVVVHQMSRKRTQAPFKRHKGVVEQALFHPTDPLLFVGTAQSIRVYDLVRHAAVSRLRPNVQSLSDFAIHPSGNHVLSGAFGSRVSWVDMEVGVTPYKALRYHEGAVRRVALSPRWPLFATAGDDGNLALFHCTVPTDPLQNVAIVPIRTFAAHPAVPGVGGCMAIAWHPSQPWIATGGSDGLIRILS
jgi:ribosome biogenesis protein ERB1